MGLPLLKKAVALFPGQQPGERVYLVTRQHWMIFAKQIAVWLVFVVVLILTDTILFEAMPFLNESPYIEGISLFKTVYLMYLIAGLFTLWIQFHLNFQIVTNERLVDVDQKNLLNHTTSELHIHNIEDVTAEIKGILGTLFNYGTVYVQTAGQVTFFEFNNVPNPHRIAKLILDLYERLPSAQPNRRRLKRPTLNSHRPSNNQKQS